MQGSDIQQRMSTLARDLRSEQTPGDTLQRIVDYARTSVHACEAAGMSLTALRSQSILTSAATSELPTRANELQQELGEGPCMDAAWKHRVVSAPDLSRDERWPLWAPRAVEELGVHSMLCLQLFTHEGRLGALNLFSSRPQAFDHDDVDEASALAAHAAVALAAAQQLQGLETALHNRTVIGTAIGVTMTRYGLTQTQALGVLKRLSSHENRKLAELAAEVVAQADDENTQHRP